MDVTNDKGNIFSEIDTMAICDTESSRSVMSTESFNRIKLAHVVRK